MGQLLYAAPAEHDPTLRDQLLLHQAPKVSLRRPALGFMTNLFS